MHRHMIRLGLENAYITHAEPFRNPRLEQLQSWTIAENSGVADAVKYEEFGRVAGTVGHADVAGDSEAIRSVTDCNGELEGA